MRFFLPGWVRRIVLLNQGCRSDFPFPIFLNETICDNVILFLAKCDIHVCAHSIKIRIQDLYLIPVLIPVLRFKEHIRIGHVFFVTVS